MADIPQRSDRASGAAMPSRTIVYSSLGHELQVYALDAATGGLDLIQSFRFPAVVMYGWANRARTMFYIASSDSGPMAKVKQPNHFLHVFMIRPSGTLDPLTPPLRLSNRPLHLSLDADESHILLAYNDPPDVTVHRIEPNGAIGAEVEQTRGLAFGTTVHQVRVTPPGTLAIVPACAHHETGAIPGSLGIFSYSDGRLAPLARMEADPRRAAKWLGVRNGAHGFAARHVDFHPTRRWMYLCVETNGEIRLYDYDESSVAPEPRFIRSTLEGTPPGRSAQLASAIHVHPNGRYVYVSNRAWDAEPVGDSNVFVGGVNDIAVFAIDQTTGEPTLIQHIDTRGIFPRTFGIDAAGRMLVAGNQEPGYIRVGDTIERVVPSLVVYRIGDDGRLTLVNKHDHADNSAVCFWVGVLSL
jgi:6-phosphogluconolactonase (cycloisomerase 2 family)